MFCDLLIFDGFTKPLGYDSNRQETDGGIVAQVRAWADAADMSVALGAELYLPRESGPVVIRSVRAGVQRTSTKRSAELPLDIHESPEGPALHRDEVYAAFTSLMAEVSLAAEAVRAREIGLPFESPPQDAHWDAIEALEGRVTALEAGAAKPGKKEDVVTTVNADSVAEERQKALTSKYGAQVYVMCEGRAYEAAGQFAQTVSAEGLAMSPAVVKALGAAFNSVMMDAIIGAIALFG